jgi:tellurite resistance protein TerA
LWRFSATGQGFNGGLDALIRHFGGEVAEPVVVQQPKVSLSKVTLTKAGETHKVSLAKGAGAPAKLIVKATWTDNGDGSADNDDLDLRVGVLFPDGRMYFVTAPDAPGSLERVPYVRHLGDVTGASKNEPATETVEVNPSIANLVGGPVTLVFSIYSALANGTVSVASMSPKMRMEYGLQIVECAYDFSAMKGGDDGVYTYVIGTASISGDAIELSPSGMTSTAGTENTPWLSRTAGGSIRISMDGPAVFKAALRSKETKYNASNPRRYS